MERLAVKEKISALGYFGNILYEKFLPILKNLSVSLAREKIKYDVCGDDCAKSLETKELMKQTKKIIETFDDVAKEKFFIESLKNNVTLPKEDAGLNDIIRNIVNYYQPESVNKKLEIHLELEDGLPTIKLDVDKVDYAIERILLNSIQSKDYGVNIKIKTYKVKEGDEQYIILEISDNGCGIVQENIERVFTPFFTTKEGHRGLGLTIAENILNKYDATIDIKNNYPEGTLVTVTFPLNEKLNK